MRDNIIVGLDIGTAYCQAVVAKKTGDNGNLRILGVGKVPSSGLRKGVVVDIGEVIGTIRECIKIAERTSGVPINHAYVSIGGAHIEVIPSHGVVAVSRADEEISEVDISRAVESAQAISLPPNREIIHLIPREFSVDKERGIKDPIRMKGRRLEVEALIIHASSPFVRNLIKATNEAGIEIDELVLSTLASSGAVLTKRQKELGVATVDIGGGTVGLSVFEEGNLIHAKILPFGASHITNDIAIGLRTSIDLAEDIKLKYGFATVNEVSKKETVDFSKLSKSEEGSFSRRAVAEIIEARLSEIFSLFNKELKKIDRERNLPAGVVLIGCGAKMPGIVDLAKRELMLPCQIGFPLELEGIFEEVDDPSFATACGLIFWGLDKEGGLGNGFSFSGIPSVGKTVSKIKGWFRTLLP